MLQFLSEMDLGISLAIYLTLALLFIGLICILTKYFHYRVKVPLRESSADEMLSDELKSSLNLQEEEDEDYYKQEERRKETMRTSIFGKKKLSIQVMNVKQVPLKTTRNKASLIDKLNNQLVPLKQQNQFSKSSLKAFKTQQLNSTKFASNILKIEEKQQKLEVHEYLSKLVGYEEGSIIIIEMNVKKIRKDETNTITENKKMERSVITLQEEGKDGFGNYLQAFHFNELDYGGYKYLNRVQINNMAKNEWYQIKSLKISEYTEWICLAQFKHMSQTVNSI